MVVVLDLWKEAYDTRSYQAKTVVAPLDRVKILFQASNPDFQKYAGVFGDLEGLLDVKLTRAFRDLEWCLSSWE